MTFLGPDSNYPVGVGPFSSRFREIVEEMAAICFWVDEHRLELERTMKEEHPPHRPLSAGFIHALTLDVFEEFDTNRWEYHWISAVLDPITLEWDFDNTPGAPSSITPPFRPARNKAEQRNNDMVAAHGVDITGAPEFSATVEPLPFATPITLFFSGTVTVDNEDFIQHFFSEVNAVNFTCVGTAR